MVDVGAVIAVIICVISAGLASGLTQGLISLDHLELTIKARSGTELEKKWAKGVLPLVENHHLLLVSLMLWNAAANEILPIYLDVLVPTVVAIVMSVSLVLIVGEILPASIMTGPKQLEIAYSLKYLVYVVLIFFFPLAYPISKLLDYTLGVGEKLPTYNRMQLSEMMKIQHEEQLKKYAKSTANGGAINSVEHSAGVNVEDVTMISGVLKYSDELVRDIMSQDIFMLSIDQKLSIQVYYYYVYRNYFMCCIVTYTHTLHLLRHTIPIFTYNTLY